MTHAATTLTCSALSTAAGHRGRVASPPGPAAVGRSAGHHVRVHQPARISLGTRPLPALPKMFKDYEPGFVYVDIKYLPQIPNESARRYLFVAIDSATHWVCLRVYTRREYAFDRWWCQVLGIEQRLCPPRRPQTNGRISERIARALFTCAEELETTLIHYAVTYNHRIPQRALDHISLFRQLRQWRILRPDWLVKRVYEHSELDK